MSRPALRRLPAADPLARLRAACEAQAAGLRAQADALHASADALEALSDALPTLLAALRQPAVAPSTEYLSLSAAAARLQVNRHSLAAALERGDVRGTRIGSRWRIPVSALEAWS